MVECPSSQKLRNHGADFFCLVGVVAADDLRKPPKQYTYCGLTSTNLRKVLACAIVVVFCVGLLKLWHSNRLLKKHMILDEEKQARQQEMRRSGLPIGKRMDIPFGVRAIQSGIEVDGIWISRPGTPADSEGIGAASTLIGSVSELKGKEKVVPVTGGLRTPTTAVIEVEPTPNQSPTPSLLDRNDPIYAPAPLRISHVGPQSTYRPTHSSQRHLNTSTDTTRLGSLPQFEVASRAPRLETYIPTSSLSAEQNGAYRPMKRSSGSFDDEDLEEYQVPSLRYQDRPLVPPPRRRSPFDDSELDTDYTQRGGYFAGVEAEPERRRDLFESVELEGNPRDPQTVNHRANNSYESADSQMRLPQRSYSGETHVNVSSRRVNAGFEVLPAGTFSRSNSQADMESSEPNRSRNRISNVTNRLHKKGHNRS